MIDPKYKPGKTQRELVRIWVTAIEESARDFFPHPGEFCRRVYENAASNLINIICNEYGYHMKPAGTIKEAIEAYIELAIKSGLFEDTRQFVLKEINPNKLEVSVFNCVYLPCCQDILDRGSVISELTCPRLGCFAGVAGITTDIACSHTLTGFNPGKCCEGFIERI
ncbi:MAG: hypothetical protein ABRQ37_15275 [Candidatus Eremiobacterota bacterium]